MGIEELKKHIEEVEAKINLDFTELGREIFAKDEEYAAENCPEIAKRIRRNNDEIKECNKQINLIKGIVICENCGAEVKNTHTFCQECGHKMKMVTTDVPEGFILCGNCNATVPEGSKFCYCCGAKIDNAGVAEKNSPNVLDEIFGELAEEMAEVAEEISEEIKAVEEELLEATEEIETAIPEEMMELDIFADEEVEEDDDDDIDWDEYISKDDGNHEGKSPKCPRCHEDVLEDDSFCIACGAVFTMPVWE